MTDDDDKRYYFESAVFPAVFWVDLAKVDLKAGASPMMLAVDPDRPLAGEVSAHFKRQSLSRGSNRRRGCADGAPSRTVRPPRGSSLRCGAVNDFTGTTVLKVVDGKIVQEIGPDDGVTAPTRLGLIKAA